MKKSTAFAIFAIIAIVLIVVGCGRSRNYSDADSGYEDSYRSGGSSSGDSSSQSSSANQASASSSNRPAASSQMTKKETEEEKLHRSYVEAQKMEPAILRNETTLLKELSNTGSFNKSLRDETLKMCDEYARLMLIAREGFEKDEKKNENTLYNIDALLGRISQIRSRIMQMQE